MPWPERRLGAAAVLRDGDGRVLLVRHTYGALNWELPGGASEPGESIIETATREVKEETGLDVVLERMTGVYYDAQHDAHHFVFRGHSVGSESAAPSSGEVDACEYWTRDELPRPISDFTIRRIDDAIASKELTMPIDVPPRRLLH